MRRPDWQERLWATLQDAQRMDFAFGKYDCVHLVAACLDAMTGSHWQTRLNTFYRGQRGALRVMRQAGLLESIVTRELQREPLPINLARRGDVCALTLETGPAIGICVGERVAVASEGVLYLPLSRAHCAWPVE